MSLIEGFWSESTPQVRRLLLDEAGGRTSGGAEFNFDMFDVELDFDGRRATVSDVLPPNESASTDLAEFLDRARSYGDDPSIGDGLTEMQRRPPRFRSSAGGEMERIEETP